MATCKYSCVESIWVLYTFTSVASSLTDGSAQPLMGNFQQNEEEEQKKLKTKYGSKKVNNPKVISEWNQMLITLVNLLSPSKPINFYYSTVCFSYQIYLTTSKHVISSSIQISRKSDFPCFYFQIFSNFWFDTHLPSECYGFWLEL